MTQGDVDKAMAALDVVAPGVVRGTGRGPVAGPEWLDRVPGDRHLGEPRRPSTRRRWSGPRSRTFDLGVSATGTVTAVDDAPVASIAEARLRDSVATGSQLVEDSITVDVGEAVVTGGVVSFPVTASATQVAVLDPAELEAQVLGKTRRRRP